MRHIYKDKLDETNVNLITNDLIKLKEFRDATVGWVNLEHLFVLVYLSLMLNKFYVTLQYPLIHQDNIDKKKLMLLWEVEKTHTQKHRQTHTISI